MDEKKKKIFIILGIIAVVVVAFLIYWKATEHDRYIKSEMNNVLQEISDYRSGESSYLYLWLDSSALEDPNFLGFLVEQASNMIENDEYRLLDEFLGQLEGHDVYISEIRDTVTNSFESVDNLEDAFKIKETLKYLDYYNANLNINRDSTLIATYIESNGIEEITTTPGTGFYANEENRSSSHKVGLSNSPLYDDESITYHGDFMIRRKHGVKLNSYYEETSYSDTSGCFRDNYIDFSPDDGECIYSGDYLFCFASNGTLIDFAEID